MKNFSKLAALGALLSASASFALADTISLGSFATGTTAASLGFSSSQTALNLAGFTPFSAPPPVGSTPTLLSGTATTYTLPPNGVWGAPTGNSTWVGIANGGPGGTDPGYGYYQFTTQFTALGGSYSGTMSLMADDTAEVLLNGVVILPFTSLGSDSHCADTGVSCSIADVIQLTNLNLLPGTDTNMFTFVVEQAGVLGSGDPSGLNFTTSLSRVIAPEPRSLMLFGTGLLGALPIFFRRRKQAIAAA
jgi:hypothetical protein